MINININDILKVARKYNYTIFSDAAKEHNLNLWVIRNKNRHAGTYDDLLLVFWIYGGRWHIESFEVTADPSDIALIQRKNKLGTAIVREGQYRGCWKLGIHNINSKTNSYPALVQRGEIEVIRDFNKDSILDIPTNDILDRWGECNENVKVGYKNNNGIITEYRTCGIPKYRTERGSKFGINCHRASRWNILETIGLYSEGCIVHKNPNRFVDEFIPLCKSASINYGNSFSLTLVHEERFINI